MDDKFVINVITTSPISLMRIHMLSQVPHSQQGFNQDQFEQLCTWIDEHIQEQIGWSELMRESGFDHLSIQSSFAKYKATTPMTYIRKRREDFKSVRNQSERTVQFLSLLAK